MPILLKCEADYADEFDVYGLVIIDSEEWENFKKQVHDIDYPIEIYFGTNEAILFESSDSVLQSMTPYEITEDEAAVFEKFLKPSYSKSGIDFGWNPMDHISDQISQL